MTRRLPWCLLALLLLTVPAWGQTNARTRTLGVGPTPTAPVGTTVRLDGLGTSGGTNVLFADGDGDIFERLLAAADIPAPFTRDDVAETVTQAWDFSAGLTGDLGVAGVISPTATTGLPASASGRLLFGAGFSSPDAGRIYFGDGTGWKLHLTSRISSTNTDRFTFSDTGRFEFREHLYPLTSYTSDLGAPSRKLRSVHAGELLIETIVAQQRITTMGGRFTVTPSNILTRDIGTGTAGNIPFCVKNASFLLFQAGVEWGSKLLMEKDGQFEWFYVTSTSTPTVDPLGDYCYAVDRNMDGSGQNAWAAGDGIVDTGKIGSGMIDQFAVRGLQSATIEGPSIDFLVRTADGYTGLSHRASLGNLNGRYGFVTDTYGLAAGEESGANLIAVAGSVKLRDGTTDKIVLDGATGDVLLEGDLLLDGGNIESAGNFEINETEGLLFADSSSDTDYPRMVRWAGGSFVRGVGTALFLTTGIGSGGRSGAIAMQGSPSAGGEVAFTSHNGTSSSQASFQAHSSGASTLLVGSIFPSTGSSLVDGTATLGLSSARYDNINLALDPNPDTAPTFVIVNKGGGGADATSGLGYIAGLSGAVTKVMGACTVTITGGIITAVTGC